MLPVSRKTETYLELIKQSHLCFVIYLLKLFSKSKSEFKNCRDQFSKLVFIFKNLANHSDVKKL